MEDETMTTKSKIVNASMFWDALKHSGYRGTDNAVAEIVDNSIDAEAKNVFVIGNQKVSGNGEKSIVSFAFLDDGKGMDFDTLKGCLTVGYTTNQAQTGIGRFGVGLPQASIFVCDRVEVYSWQNGIANCKRVYLDGDEVKQKDLNEIEDPVVADIPKEYKRFLNWNANGSVTNFEEHGTLVVWTKCTNVDYKKWKTCVNHMKEDLGRKYRYYLKSNDHKIKMIELNTLESTDILPNDPLFLMTPNVVAVPADVDTFKQNGYVCKEYDINSAYTEPLFELFKPNGEGDGTESIEIVFEENGERKTGIATVTYSVVKKKYYSPQSLKTDKKPGSLPYGKEGSMVAKNTGISIVRNGRELDFNSFGFYDNYNVPEYRWWGIEISFHSDLDKAFGVSNNKQSVDLRSLSKEDMQEAKDDDIKTVWHQLAISIIPTIKALTARNSSIRSEEVNPDNPIPLMASEIATKVDGIDEDLVPTEGKTEAEIKEEAVIQLKDEGTEEPTEGQIKQLIDSKVRVVTVYNKSPRDSFVDVELMAGTLSIILNAKHDFYELLVKKIMDDENDKVPFELFVMAVMKSIKYLDTTYPDAMDTLLFDINDRVRKYISEYKKQNG